MFHSNKFLVLVLIALLARSVPAFAIDDDSPPAGGFPRLICVDEAGNVEPRTPEDLAKGQTLDQLCPAGSTSYAEILTPEAEKKGKGASATLQIKARIADPLEPGSWSPREGHGGE